jgi:hypoxanthine-guanine phosphoribosyltransferase
VIGFFRPVLLCAPHEIKDHQIVVLVDVVHSGGFLQRVSQLIQQSNPDRIIPATVINQGDQDII